MMKSNTIKIILRLSVSILLLIVIITYADITRVVNVISEINLNYVYLAIICIFSSVLIGAINAFIIIVREKEVTWKQFLPIFWLGWALSLVTPGQVGDVAGISTMLRRYKVSWHISIGRSLVDKLISLIITVGLALIGLFTVIKGGLIFDEFIRCVLVLGASFFVIVFVLLLLISLDYFNPDSSGIAGLIARAVLEIKTSITDFPLLIALNSSLTTIKIIFIGIAYWAIFKALGQTLINAIDVIPLVAASSLIAYVPISFNGIGTVEIAGTWLFSMLSVSASVVVSAYLLLRLIVYVLAWVPASLWLINHSSGVDK